MTGPLQDQTVLVIGRDDLGQGNFWVSRIIDHGPVQIFCTAHNPQL